MSYLALHQSLNAEYYCSFNNTLTPEILNGTQTIVNTVPRTYLNTAPAGLGTTHSVNLHGYSTTQPQTIQITGLPEHGDELGLGTDYRSRDFGGPFRSVGWTLSAWFKIDRTTEISSLGAKLFYETYGTTGSSGDYNLQIFSGDYNDYFSTSENKVALSGVPSVTNAQNASVQVSLTSADKLSPNLWHHIAAVVSWNKTGNVSGFADGYFEQAIYIDGTLQGHSIGSLTDNGFSQYNMIGSNASKPLTVLQAFYATSTTQKANAAHMAVFKKPLTQNEIRQLAWYGKSVSDYTSTITAKNPVYFSTLENPTKEVEPFKYGTKSSWSVLSDDFAAATVNTPGKFGKCWKMGYNASSTDGGQFKILTDPTTLTDLSSLLVSNEYTIEFWAKAPYGLLPVSPKHQISWNNTTTGALLDNGMFRAVWASNGSIQMTLSRKSSATAWSTSTPNVSSISSYQASDTTNFKGVQHTIGNRAFRMFDGEWHHYALRVTKSKGGLNGTLLRHVASVFVDGRLTASDIANSFGYITGTNTSQIGVGQVILNNNVNFGESTNRDIEIDNFAIYDSAISNQSIMDNYINGMNYLNEYGVVKYYDGTWKTSSAAKVWNGTAWINWNKQYYNGSAWVVV